MELLGLLILIVASLVTLVCHILVIVKMFQNGHTGLGIACIILMFCCGIGYAITLIYGWMKASQWNIRNLMIVYTIALVLDFLGLGLNPGVVQQQLQQIQQQQQR
jgi:hypothetical protein